MDAKSRIAFNSRMVAIGAGFRAAQNGPCDRTCLEGMISAYLTALAAHEPARLPVAPGVKYAENDQPLPLGAGEWQIARSSAGLNWPSFLLSPCTTRPFKTGSKSSIT